MSVMVVAVVGCCCGLMLLVDCCWLLVAGVSCCRRLLLLFDVSGCWCWVLWVAVGGWCLGLLLGGVGDGVRGGGANVVLFTLSRLVSMFRCVPIS